MPRILMIAGEASGDLHGAHLAKAITALDPSAQLVGIGGAGMRAAGVTMIPGVPQLDVMGLIGLSAVRALVQRVRAIRRVLKAEAWDLVVLIDNPGLNFHFARVAKAAGRRVLYYIAPQVWAWRPGRMKWIQRRVDHVVVILPFEPELYRRAGVRCTFVGHPLLDSVAPQYDRAALRARFNLDESAPVVGLFPGSRVAKSKCCCRCFSRRPLNWSRATRKRSLSWRRPRQLTIICSRPCCSTARCRSSWCNDQASEVDGGVRCVAGCVRDRDAPGGGGRDSHGLAVQDDAAHVLARALA